MYVPDEKLETWVEPMPKAPEKYAKAKIDSIYIDTMKIYPDTRKAKWVVGQEFSLYIVLKNVGEADGKLWCRIIDAKTGEEIGERRVSATAIPVGSTWGTSYKFTMTEEGYDVFIEAGHIEPIGGRI